jgi:archaellum component FlaF (FlaF/FlaG flagellin family)
MVLLSSLLMGFSTGYPTFTLTGSETTATVAALIMIVSYWVFLALHYVFGKEAGEREITAAQDGVEGSS